MVRECGLGEFVNENVDVDRVECFGKVKCYHDGSMGWFWLVEASSYGMCGLLQGRCGGMFAFEAVLVWWRWDVCLQSGKEQSLNGFGDWREKCYRSI